MADKTLSSLPIEIPLANDKSIFMDESDSDFAKQCTIEEFVAAGLAALDADSLNEWPNNKFMTQAERDKLNWIAPGAEPNEVESVNWQQGIVTLDQDDIPNGSNYVRTKNNFTDLQLSRVNNSVSHQNNTANPHGTTKTHVWLWDVKNAEQISNEDDEFSAFARKTSPHNDDRILIENSSDSLKKRYVTIWDILTEFFKPVATRFKNSLELDVDDKVQLVWDEETPQHRYGYQTRNWVKMRASNMAKNRVEAVEELIIDENDQYIVFWPLTVEWVISGDGDLVIL